MRTCKQYKTRKKYFLHWCKHFYIFKIISNYFLEVEPEKQIDKSVQRLFFLLYLAWQKSRILGIMFQ
jgi:hypothetical protein